MEILAAASLVLFAVATSGGGSVGQPGQAQLPAALDPLIPQYSPQVDRALKALKRGIEDYREGQYTSSLTELPDESAIKSTALYDYALFYRAKSALMLERSGEALKDFQQIQADCPDSPLFVDAFLGESQARLKLRDPGGAMAALRNPRLGQSADALYYQGRASEQMGERQKAEALYLRVYCDFVNSEVATQAQESLLALSPGALSGARNYKSLLTRADNLLRAGRNREARTLLIRLGRVRAPDKVSSEKRDLLYADTEYRLGKAATVLPQLRKVSKTDPTMHARAIYLEGVCYRRLKREVAFLETRNRALDLYPKSPYTERLLVAVASHYDVSNEVEQAREAYREIYTRFPKGTAAERALFRTALFFYVKGQYADALRGFYQSLRAYPEPGSAIPAIYWMARCYERLGDTNHALFLLERIRALANYSYYSRRAAEAEDALRKPGDHGDHPYAGLSFEEVAAAAEGIRLPLATISAPSAAVAQVIERARQLYAADLSDLALSELRSGLQRFPADAALSYVMARFYEIKNDYFSAITILRRAFPDYNDRPVGSLPKEVWALLFPVKHWDIISRRSASYDVDPNFVLGLIRQESAFAEGARSTANARGLMQVLPSTGRRVARQAGVKRYAVSKLYSAETNISLGLHHLASLLRSYDGNEELALAAYNAGDERAELWKGNFGVADMAEFVERVPFSETRNYIKQVLTNKAHYAVLTAAPAATNP